LSIRAVAAEIGFPVSTVASNLKFYSQEKTRWAAEKLERATRGMDGKDHPGIPVTLIVKLLDVLI
jgi:hypothetical protein